MERLKENKGISNKNVPWHLLSPSSSYEKRKEGKKRGWCVRESGPESTKGSKGAEESAGEEQNLMTTVKKTYMKRSYLRYTFMYSNLDGHNK